MRIERILIVMFFLSVVMRLLHWQGGDIIMTVALFGLSVTYFGFGFYVLGEPGYRRNMLLISIIAGILLSTVPLGILFRLMYWPLSKTQVMFGGMFSLIILVVAFILNVSTDNPEHMRSFYKKLMIRSTVLLVVSSILFFVSRAQLLRIEYWDDAKMAALKTRYYRFPDNVSAKQELTNYIKQKETHKQK